MLIDLFHRFRHWVRLHRLDEPDAPLTTGTMPIVLVIWPDRETFCNAVATVKRDEDLRYQARLGQPTPAPSFIQDVPLESWVLNGMPVAFTTLDGKRLVPIRPLNQVRVAR